MEAILALMVVTVAIVLLSLSFSLAAYDAAQESSGSRLDACIEDMRTAFLEDKGIWRDGKMSWPSVQYRQGEPYSLAEGLSGYTFEVIDISSGKDSIIFGIGTLDENNYTASERLACSIVTADGEVHSGLVVITVW